jgi:hypothetical protein
VQLPEGNLFDVEPQRATFVAHDWVALIRGLRPGVHVIMMDFIGGPLAGSTTLTLDVVRRR